MTPARITKKRALEKAGFVHVAGWLPKEEATAVSEKIQAALAEVEKAASK